jgi:uncharacterized protein (TIGR02145 family)
MISRKTGIRFLIILALVTFMWLPGSAQIMVSPTGKPASLVICGDNGLFSIQIANTTGATMIGAILTLDLPPGCRYSPGSIVNATEFNITNLNQPVFTLPDILNNTAHQVSYQAGLICGYTNTTDFVYIVTYNASNYSGTDPPLQNFYYPEPVITGISNNPVSIPLFTTTTRDITIQQQGANASADTLILLDQHTADIQVISVSIGQLHLYVGAGPLRTDTILLTGSDLPGGNGLFDPGETITITETVSLVGCTNGQSTLKSTWGCYQQYCAFNTAYATINVPSGSPAMNIAFTANRRSWGFIDNSGWVDFTVTNTGSGTGGTAYDVVVLSGFSSGGSTYYPNGNWINKIDSFSVNGFQQLATYNYGTGAANGQFAFYTKLLYTFDPDGSGTGLTDADLDGYFDDLPAGQSFTVRAHTYYSWSQAVSTIATGNSCGNGWTNSSWQAFRFGYNFKNQCSVAAGVNWIANPTVNQFMTYNTNTAQVVIPSDLYDGVPVWFEHTVNTTSAVNSEGCPSDSVVYKVVLPPGVVPYLPYTATFKAVSMGAPLVSGDTLRFILDKSRILSGGLFRVPVVADCQLYHAPTASIHAELKFWCDKTNFRNRFFTYWCVDSPVFGIQCPVGNCPDPSISVFTVTRHTLGWTNNRCTTRVAPAAAGLRLDNAMARDTIRIQAKGSINNSIDSLYFKLKHTSPGGAWGNQLFFDVLTDTLRYYNIENDTWYTCPNLSPLVTNGTTSTLYTYFGGLTAPGGCLAGLTFSDGDSVHYVVYGRVKNIAQMEWRTVPALRALFLWKEANKEASCNDQGYTFNVLGSNYTFLAGTNYQQIILQGCSTFVYEGLINRSLDVCGGSMAFPNEIRPLWVIDTAFFTLPEGFAYQAGSAIHRYYNDNGSVVTETIADPVITMGPTGTRLMFIRTPGWNYSDYYDCNGNYDMIRFSAGPSCKATGDFNYGMDMRGRNKFYADGLGTYQATSSTKGVTYTAPLMSLTTLVGTAEGRQDSVDWTVSVCNSRSFASGNNWLGFESGNNGIRVVRVTDVTVPSAPVEIPVAGYGTGKYWSQLGTFNGNACKTIRIRAVYSTCSFDSLLVKHGYNCAGYPLNPELGYPISGYSCTQNTKWLYLDPKEISLNLALTSPTNPVNLCDTLDYETQVTNAQLAYGSDLKLTVTLPPGTFIPDGVSRFMFPYSTGTWVPLGNPVNQPAGSNQWVYDISSDPNGVVLLKGSDSIPENGYKLRFRLLTNCDFTSGTSLNITASAANACGDVQERSSGTDPILISGLPSNVNLYVISTAAPGNLQTCSDPSEIKIKVINLGPSSVSQIEKLGVNIDDAFDYVENSLTGIHNGPSGVAGNMVIGGIRYINFSIQPNLAVNDSIVFTFQIKDIDPAGLRCDTITLETTTLLVAEVSCQSAPGGTCLIQSITSSILTHKPVIKDRAAFGGYTATSIPDATSGEMITVDYRILNTGSDTLRTTTLNVYFVHDANGNGLPDDTGFDSLYFQDVTVAGLLPGDSIPVSATFAVPAARVCGMLAAMRLAFNGCICSDAVLPVNNIRLINAGSDTSVCEQVPMTIGSDSISGYQYIWVPSVYLSSHTLSDPVFLYNSTLTQRDTLTYTLLTTRPGNCISRDTMVVVVLPAAIAYAGKDTVVCGTTPYPLTDASALNPLSIQWTTSGTGTFSNDTLISPVYFPSPEDVISGQVSLSLMVPGQCGSDSDAMILSLTPQVTVGCGPDTAICEQMDLAVTGATATHATGLLWTTTGDGHFSDSSLLNPVYSPGPADIAAGTTKLVLAATGMDPCPVISDTLQLTLSPPPNVTNAPPFSSICSGTAAGVVLMASQPGTTFTWTALPGTGAVTGYGPGNGPVINDILLNPDLLAGSVIYTITPDQAGCIGPAFDYTVEVRPLPHVTTAVEADSVCSAGMTSILLTANLAGPAFEWTATGSSPQVSGYAPGNGAAITQALVNAGFNTERVTYHVTATVNGCPGPSADLYATVFPVPDVIFTPPLQTICGNTPTSLDLSSHAGGASFTWTASGSSPLVTGYAPGSGFLISQLLQNLGLQFETVTYLASPVANGCPGVASATVVTVKPLARVSLPSCFDATTTTAAKPFLLRGGVPNGGWYSGPGVDTITGIFSPAMAGTGTHGIIYNYRNMYTCDHRDTTEITVLWPQPFMCGDPVTDVRDNRSYPTVQLGPQCWLAANLNHGSSVASAAMQRDNCLPEKFCYQDNPANCVSEGGLYQWDEVMQYGESAGAQGLCPPGWHIPSETDWNILFSQYINNGFAGSPLKYSGYSGFNALLGGARFNNSRWTFTGFATLFWSSDAHTPGKAWAHGMNDYNYSVSLYPSSRSNAFPVRCLKDQ